MEFPVDVLVSGRHEDLESSAQSYMTKLLYSNPDHTQHLTLSNTIKIQISPANVGFVPLYGANLKHKVLALFAPDDPFTAVALFLADQWYTVDDVLRTSDPARDGLVKVISLGERIVLYVLNRVIYRTVEMGPNEVPFLCHGEDEFAKILWKNGQAVGFYSVKSKGSLCNSFVSQCYLLPVMDCIFVRKDYRGNGHGLQMLEDFVDTFKDEELGLKYPLTQAIQKVCSQYLSRYPADVDLLWEVEGVGGHYQKVKVANKLRSLALSCNHSSRMAEDNTNGEAVNEASRLDITEEVVAVNKHLRVTEEKHESPVSTRTWSSERRLKKRQREEPEESPDEKPPEKINRSAKAQVDVEPEIKDPAYEKNEEERTEETTSSDHVEHTVATEFTDKEEEPENVVSEINGELIDSQEEMEEGCRDTADDVQSCQECSPETEPVTHNGAAEEEMEGEEESDETPVEKDTFDNSEESAEEMEQVSDGKQEAVEKEQEVPSEVEEEVSPVDQEERQVTPAAVETNETDQPQEASETSSDAPAFLTDVGEAESVSSGLDCEAAEEPSPPQLDAFVEEVIVEKPTLKQDETASDILLVDEETPPATEEAVMPEEVNENDEENTTTTTTTEDEKDEGKSSEEAPDSSPDVRVLRGGRSKPVPPTPKRTSNRLSKAVVIEETEEKLEEEEEEEEEKLTSAEEEKGSTEEDDSGEEEEEEEEEEEPPVIDRRVLRRKIKVIQSTPRPKANRRSKN